MSRGTSAGEPIDFSTGENPPVVPEHTLIRCVGSGSSGQVWLARSTLGGFRAVKLVYRSRFRNDRPFEREFIGVQRFEPISRESEGFVDILQVGRQVEGEYFYYVMELADNARGASVEANGDLVDYVPRTLSRVLADERQMSLDACVDLGLALCQALGRLHGAGLIHRDVKPSNVIFVAGKPRLADIGLVVERGEALSWVGTEGFIPPEGPNSPQSDLFSLGKLLYVAATGLDRAEFPRIPSGIGSSVDGARFLELNAILLRACAASTHARYQTAGEMESDLRLLKAGGSVRRRRRGGVRRRIQVIGVPLLIAAAFFVVGRVTLWNSGGPESPVTQRLEKARSLSKEWSADGIRRLASEDDSAALVYFTEALAAATSAGEPTELHRLRIGSMQARIPDLLCDLHPGGTVFSADLSPDGKWLATADLQGAVTIWDVETGRRLHGPHASTGVAMRVRISPDGKRLLLAPMNRLPALQGLDKATGCARVLDPATGQSLAPQINSVMWGTFSQDGRQVATIGPRNRMELHSEDHPGVSFELKGHQHSVSWMAFSPDGSMLASASTDQTVRIWRTADGTPIGEPLPIGGLGMMAEFSRDGRRLATLSVDSKSLSALNVWEVAPVPKRLLSEAVFGRLFALDLRCAGGTRLLTGVENGGLSLRNLEGAAAGESEILRGGKGKCVSWVVSEDGTRVAIGTEDGAVRVRSGEDGGALSSVMRHPEAVRSMAMSRDGKRLLTVVGTASVRVWEIGHAQADWEPIRLAGTLAKQDDPYRPYPVTLVAGGRQIVFAMQRNGRSVPVCLDLASGREEPLPHAADDPNCVVLHGGRRDPVVAFHASSESADTNHVILLRHLGNSWTRTVLTHPVSVDRMVFSDDDQTLWTLDRSHSLRAWKVLDGSCVSRHSLPQSEVQGGATSLSGQGRQISWFNRDGTELYVAELNSIGFRSRTISVPPILISPMHYQRSYFLSRIMADWPDRDWKVEPVSRLPFPGAALEGYRIADLQPDRGVVLAFKGDGEVKLIHLKQRTEVRLNSESETSPLADLRFDVSGRHVLSMDVEGGVSVFDSTRGDLVALRPNYVRGTPPKWALMSADGMVITGEAPNRIRRWVVRSTTNSPEQLQQQASKSSGRRLNPQGSLIWQTP